MSCSRQNGKSQTVAALALCFLAGPWNRGGWRGLCTSLTGRLAGELRSFCELTAAASGVELEIYKSPSPGRIVGKDGATLTFLAADRSSGHSTGADLVIFDEAGLTGEGDRALWNAMYTSISSRGGRFLAISVRGDSPMFNELQARSDEPSVVWHEYACKPGVDILDEAEWHRSNPGLAAGVKRIDYMRKASRRASQTPADMSSFKSLDLNCPMSPTQTVICPVEQWTACYSQPIPERDGVVVVGFDLGGSQSMCSAVALYGRALAASRLNARCLLNPRCGNVVRMIR